MNSIRNAYGQQSHRYNQPVIIYAYTHHAQNTNGCVFTAGHNPIGYTLERPCWSIDPVELVELGMKWE